MTKEQAINKLISIATDEIGYLQKKSNSQLDNKTANAGQNNYTKYWRDVYPTYQAQSWCACFVSWCFMQAFGLDNAKKMLKHWPYVYCPTLGNLMVQYTTPQKGDIVLFHNGKRFSHTGIVISASGNNFSTIEGNTSGGSSVIANGGGVCQKKYNTANLSGVKFCRPDYSLVSEMKETTVINTKNSAAAADSNVYLGQQKSIAFTGVSIEVDGEIGPETNKQKIRVLQTALNLDYGSALTIDGEYGPLTRNALGKHYVKRGETQYMVTACEILLLLNGYNPNGVEVPGQFGSGCEIAVKNYQSDHGLSVTGKCDYKTFLSLIGQ